MSNELKPYPAYKDSGVEWIGEVPEEWEITKLKYVLDNYNFKRQPLSGEIRSGMKKEFDYYGASGVIDKVEDYIFNETMILVGEDGANLYARTSPLAFLATGKYWVNNHAHILKPKLGNIIYFVNQLENIDYSKYITGSAQPKLTQDALSNLELINPPVQVQNSICDFLVTKTSEIDSLIADKEKLITLLEEKRQAVITEAVTKGFDPNVQMKDSGIEWIGEIPEQWQVIKLKRNAKVELSNVDKKSKDDEKSVFLCNYVDVYYNNEIIYNSNFMKATAKEGQISKFRLKKDDIIITKDSESPDDIAIPAWVSTDMDDVVCGYHLAQITPYEGLDGKFLLYSFLSMTYGEQFQVLANGVTRYGILKGDIENSIFALPPIDEQIEIAKTLTDIEKGINSVEENIKDQISKLKEYRESLIYEAVTGKIDLRNHGEEVESLVAERGEAYGD